jgi:small subunit ribosomal protein S8
MSGKEMIDTPYSVFREDVLKLLKKLNYISSYTVEGDKVRVMHIALRYDNGTAAVTDVKLYSKTGRRWYAGVKELKPVVGGMGYSILSTPKGILTHVDAKKNKVGGELLFAIW